MRPFVGFEEILMHVIEETFHTEDLHRDGKLYKSKEERFDDAMTSIFGDQYERRYRQTSRLHASQLTALYKLKEQGHKLRTAIAQIAKDELPDVRIDKKGQANTADKNAYEAELTRLEDQVKKHFKRQKEHYIEITDQSLEESLAFEGALQEEKDQLKNIFKALRQAGWDIH